MKRKWKLGLIIFLVGYLILFSGRMFYVFNRSNYEDMVQVTGYRGTVLFDSVKVKNNIASSKIKVISKDTYGDVVVDQKYEKVANISSTTNDFEDDNQIIRETINEDNAVIQFENNKGIEGERILELSIGVYPEKFDGFVEKIKHIGKITDFNIKKTDKTSEYKDLNARKAALEKTRDSLIKLKENGGSIAELINLENRIFEIEEKLQNYGVQLGDYNSENELCTVKVALREKGAENIKSITVLKNTLSSLFWSAACYGIIIFSVFMTLVCLYILLIVIQKGKEVYNDMFKSTSV